MVSSLRRVDDEAFELIDWDVEQGSFDDITYLALVECAKIVRALRTEPTLELSPDQEDAVLGRISEEYSAWLALQGGAGVEAAQLVDELIGAGPALLDEVMAALAAYESSVSLDQEAARTERVRDALLQRVGGAR